MSNDIRSILDRLATVEGRLSPAQQKVPQLPALFKPKHIRALGAKTDPAHPMDGYMVGDSAEPQRTALEEAMAEIEEDMISKVKKDLTQYLNRLEKKVSINRDLKDKAKDAVQKRQPEEIEEVDGVSNPGDPGNDSIKPMQGYDPKTTGGVSNPGDPGNDSIQPMQGVETTPAATFEMDNGKSLDCYGDDNEGYELRHGEQALPSRFRSLDDAGMAVKLYQARKRQQQPEPDLSQDYIEER